MNHLALPSFWACYGQLPANIRRLADDKFKLLKSDPKHPSLHFKKLGGSQQLWSVRVGLHHRALARDKPEGIVWFWIGTHAEYDELIARG